MKYRFLALAAAALCSAACIESSYNLGGNLVPVGQSYTFHTVSIPLTDIELCMADSLNGYSSTRMAIGAVREDEYGLTTRGCAIPLIPMFSGDCPDFGKNPVFKGFHFAAAADTISVPAEDQARILQTINVYELSRPLDAQKDFDINKPVDFGTTRISKGTPIYNGKDSLSFDFTREFGEKYLRITAEDVKDYDSFIKKFPGIYIETGIPAQNGGRINVFKTQLGFNSSYKYVEGNVATLSFSAEYDGERKDTTFMFYYGATGLYDIDSLLTNGTAGQYPQYCLNTTTHETRGRAGAATDKIYVEGGGGLKPVVKARTLLNMVKDAIAEVGATPQGVVVNKASLVFPFEFPEDYTEMRLWPQQLSPTCRIKGEDITNFMNLTDASSSDENHGDINRSVFQYAPDITYHLQELLKIDESKPDLQNTKYLQNGSYDIWLLTMSEVTTTTSSGGNSDMSEYYQYLAYQNYYNSMYGGYGGYGYGGYGNYYSNYYSYMMLAQYASGSNTTTSTSMQLDKEAFFRATLNGPRSSGRTPYLKLVFGVPNDQ